MEASLRALTLRLRLHLFSVALLKVNRVLRFVGRVPRIQVHAGFLEPFLAARQRRDADVSDAAMAGVSEAATAGSGWRRLTPRWQC